MPTPRMDPECLAFVRQLLETGMTRVQVREMLEQRLGVTSMETVHRYIKAVKKQWSEEGLNRAGAMAQALVRAGFEGNKPAAVAAGIRQLGQNGQGSSPDENKKRFRGLGRPPLNDPLAGVNWMCKALLLTTADIVGDLTLSPAAQREEIRKSARVLASLIPDERIHDAEQLIRKDAALMDDRPSAETRKDGEGGAQEPVRVQAPRTGRRRRAVLDDEVDPGD